MTPLTPKQKAFVTLMTKNRDNEARGFELLLQREDFVEFFDELKEQGLFAPDRNPQQIVVDEKGSIHVPYWTALDYLSACAKRAGEAHDVKLAEKVMQIVRSVSTGDNGKIRDNFRTARKLAEIIGLLPMEAVTLDDVRLVEIWLGVSFDHGSIAHALDEVALPGYLASEKPIDWAKAGEILRLCSAVRWEAKRAGDNEKPLTIVDDYWLRELVQRHARDFGRRVPEEAAALFTERVRDVFSRGGRESWSYLYRPAVENHPQNHSWHGPENLFVEGLRDILLGWCDVEPDEAKTFIGALLQSESEILRRIGIYVLAERWDVLDELYKDVVGPRLFQLGHIHELYGLLKRRFAALDDEQKAATLKAIENISLPDGEEPERRLRLIQLRWLSSLSEAAWKPALDWLAKLNADVSIGIPEHPDFNAYMETSWGTGPSPYALPELVAFAEQGTLVERLNAFRGGSPIARGPSVESLVDTLEKAVAEAPDTFARVIAQFVGAARPYQHGLIRGFKNAWVNAKDRKTQDFDWDSGWAKLFEYFEALTASPDFKREEQNTEQAYGRSWLISAVADFLDAGARDDAHAYKQSLLPRALTLIRNLLEWAQPTATPDSTDPMFQAINSAKGRSIEALVSHSLRSCRLADRQSGTHEEKWKELQPTFDSELAKCKNGNYEFSTLAGSYIAHLDYMSPEWVTANITKIFPADSPANFVSALGGLAYSAPYRRIYQLLRDNGVLDKALAMALPGRDSRQKLIERIMVGYIWGEDSLTSARVSYSFKADLLDDLQYAVWFFSSIRGEDLSKEQRDKIIDYWVECDKWAQQQQQTPVKLFDGLGHLIWVMANLDGRNLALLMTAAPHMNRQHNLYALLQELDRLIETSPAGVAKVLMRVLEDAVPGYDYKDQLKAVLLKLHGSGQTDAAIKSCNKLIRLPGMDAVYQKLVGES